MKLKITLLVAIFALLTIACKNKKESTNDEIVDTVNIDSHGNKIEKADEEQEEDISHWSYQGETGPEHWAEFEKESDCGGKSQSPINIIALDAKESAALKPINFEYNKNTKIHEVTNNGHSIQYNFEEGDYINYEGEKYALKQFHFHEGSEHTINGVRYPIETHLVHVNKDGEILVVGILSEEGKTSEPFITLESYLPLKPDETKTMNIQFDIASILPANKAYYTYNGSLTTPPCSQEVTWIVLKNPTTISEGQVKELRVLMPINNYRNEQPLNGRVVTMTK